MEELIKLVSEKTGLSQLQAKQAVDTVLNFLEGNLPISIGGQVTGLMSADESAGSTDHPVNKLSSVLGKKHL